MTLDVAPKYPVTGSLKQVRLDEASAEKVLEYFENGWTLYNTLMSCLKSDEDYYRIPNTLRRPLIFYLGHTAVFFVNKFVAAGILTVRPLFFLFLVSFLVSFFPPSFSMLAPSQTSSMLCFDADCARLLVSAGGATHQPPLRDALCCWRR